MLFAAVTGPFWHPGISVLAVLLLPMVLDGGIQRLADYESTNLRRLITGALFGYGFLLLVVLYLGAAYRWGHGIGVRLRGFR